MIQAYCYQFFPSVDPRRAEDTLRVAMLAAEGLFGEARVRLDTGYAVDEDTGTIAVMATTPVGQAVNAMFTALILRRFGRSTFFVRAFEGRGQQKEGDR